MNLNHSNCSVFEIFLGFLVGLAWFLLAIFGVIDQFFGGIGWYAIGDTVSIIIAIVGFIVILLLGFCILKKVWGCCFGRKC
jgi:hypothetical protein